MPSKGTFRKTAGHRLLAVPLVVGALVALTACDRVGNKPPPIGSTPGAGVDAQPPGAGTVTPGASTVPGNSGGNTAR